LKKIVVLMKKEMEEKESLVREDVSEREEGSRFYTSKLGFGGKWV
jgi:hypothetical protein